MDTLLDYQYNISSVLVLPNPEPSQNHALALLFNITYRHFILTGSDTLEEVSPRSHICLPVTIPPSCVCDPDDAVLFVHQVCRTTLCVPLTTEHVGILVAAILRVDSGMSVVTDMVIDRIVSLVDGDHMVTVDPYYYSIVDESVIFDADSSDSGYASDKIMLKYTTFDGSSDQTTCSICLDDFEQGCAVAATLCSHLFHSECIKKWILRKTSCPICRSQLSA